MNKNLLTEINRIGSLMGTKTLISEQTVWLNLIKQLIKKGASTADTVIDDVADMLVAQGKMTRQDADEAATLLKNDPDLMNTLKNKYTKRNLTYGTITSADDLSLIRKMDNLVTSSGSKNVDDFVKKLSKVSDEEYEVITKNIITKMYNEGSLSLAQEGYAAVLKFWEKTLAKKFDDTTDFLNLADFESSQIMWAYDYCKKVLAKEGTKFTDESAEQFIELFRKRFNEEPTIKGWIQKFKDAKRIDVSPPVITKPSLTSELDLPKELSDIGSTKSAFKNSDEITPIIDDVTDDVVRNNFAFKWFKSKWGELIINAIRGFGKSPEAFKESLQKSIDDVIEINERLKGLNPGDANRNVLEGELRTAVGRLKSDMVLVQTPDKMFISVWEDVQKSIKEVAGEEEGKKIISKIQKGGPKESIEEFVKFVETVDTQSNIRDVYSGYETIGEYFNSKLKTFNEYKANVAKTWQDSGKETGYVAKLIAVSTKILIDGLTEIVKRGANYLTIGTLRYVTTIRSTLALGRLTKLQGLRRVILLYIEITLISNIINPVLEFFKDWYLSFKENVLMTEEDKGISAWENFIINLKARIPVLGNEFEWNPFFNPIPGVDLSGVGFKRAPLPEFLVGLVGNVVDISTADRQTDQNVRRKDTAQKELDILQDKIINEQNTTSVSEYNSSDETVKNEVQEKYFKSAIFEVLDAMVGAGDLTEEDVIFIKSRTRFLPGVTKDYFKVLEETNPEAFAKEKLLMDKVLNYENSLGNGIKIKPSPEVIKYYKDSKEIKNIKGNFVVNGGGKDFILDRFSPVNPNIPKNLVSLGTNAKSDTDKMIYGRIVWVTPSVNEITENTTRKYNHLKDFVLNYNK